MKRLSIGFAKCVFLSLLILELGCSTQAVRQSRRGLLEDHDGVASNGPSGRVSRKTASEVYAPREGTISSLPGKWGWPLTDVEISSSYGDRGRKFHQGIDLRAKVGTPVHAASSGEVVYVGTKIKGYGRMVVLRHEGGYYTVYAHHSKNLVKLNQKIALGEVIAYSGKSGHSHGAHLHFEIRRGTQSYDPEYALNGHLKSSVNRKIASKSHLTHEFEE